MTLTASEIRVAGTGELFTAAASTAAPANPAAASLTGYAGRGYTREDGITISKGITREGISSWQALTPTRYRYTGVELSVAAEFQQSNSKNVKAWLNSGDFAETVASSGIFKATMPTVPETVVFALLVRWFDDTIWNALWIPKVEIAETGDLQLGKSGEVAFGLTFSAVAPNSGTTQAEWYTNDTAFATP